MAWDEANDGPFYGVEAPTVAVQQCGACLEAWGEPDVCTCLPEEHRAFLTSTTPPDVAGLIERLEQAGAEYRDRLPATSSLFFRAATALRLSAGGGVPEGWKLVPVEPTPEMIGAFWRQKNCGTQGVGERGPQTDDYSADRAMLAASPTVEAGHVE